MCPEMFRQKNETRTQEETRKMNLQGNMKWVLLIGGILVCAVCAIVARGGTNLLGGNTLPSAPIGGLGNEPTPVVINDNPNSNVQLSQIVMARTIGEGNEPVQVTNQFRATDRAIYAVVRGTIPSGARLFARWSRNGSPFEDTNEIVADRDYASTNIEFHISPDGQALETGNYSVQIFVDGNPGPQAQFSVS